MYKVFFKRLFDILLAIAALAVVGLFLVILGVIVKIKLGSPALFKQIRPGKDGKLFYIYKFRTMLERNDEKGRPLPDEQRQTKFGNFLRRTSIDELPQIINILKGDMSFIGPRPRLAKDVVFYATHNSLTVRPGLTGRSQVYGRNDNSWQQVFEHDTAYAEKVTLLRDIKIFLLTFPALFRVRQSEKRINKLYADELLARNQITENQYMDRLALASEMETAFVERDEQMLKESLHFIVEYNMRKDKEQIAEPDPISLST